MQEHSPPQQSHNKLFVLRGPLLWLFGISALTSISIVTWDYLATLHAAIIPLVFVAFFILVTIWTISCGAIFTHDLYNLLVYPTIVQPAIKTASKYSIDDLFTILCDPTQLASYLSAIFIVPITLYSLPITSTQRAKVLSALIPHDTFNDNNDSTGNKRIFTEAGGWKYLLPRSMQRLVDKSNVNNIEDNLLFEHVRIDDALTIDGILYHDIHCTSTDDEDSNENDSNEGKDIERKVSANQPTRLYSQKRNTFTEDSHRVPFRNNEAKISPTPTDAQGEIHQDEDVSQMFANIFIDLMENKLQSTCQRLKKHRSTMALTSIVTFTILLLQLRRSHTARSIVKTLAHILLTTTCSSTFLVSILACLAPYLHQPLLQKQQEQQRHGEHRAKRGYVLGGSLKALSMIFTNATFSIPKSLPLPMMNKIQQFLVRWKGTVALFLLTYYQYRHQKIQQHSSNTQR
jgi:hypothetical protein